MIFKIEIKKTHNIPESNPRTIQWWITGLQLCDRSKLKCLKRQRLYRISTTVEEPTTYNEFIKSTGKKRWTEKWHTFNGTFQENQTRSLENLSSEKRAILKMNTYKVNINTNGTLDKFKARLVIKGFSQQKSIDQTFSPVARAYTSNVTQRCQRQDVCSGRCIYSLFICWLRRHNIHATRRI